MVEHHYKEEKEKNYIFFSGTTQSRLPNREDRPNILTENKNLFILGGSPGGGGGMIGGGGGRNRGGTVLNPLCKKNTKYKKSINFFWDNRTKKIDNKKNLCLCSSL